jgi:GNAT superfamily N-acetyltransferase
MIQLSSHPLNEHEQWRIKMLADYDVKEGSVDNTRCVYVGEEHVGFYVLHLNYLQYFYIFKEYRQRGFGLAAAALLCALHPNLYLHSTPAARRFWERCGFKAKHDNGDESDRACVQMTK